MKWAAKERNPWRTCFAWFPVRIGEIVVWGECYQRRFIGEYYEVRELPARNLGPDRG